MSGKITPTGCETVTRGEPVDTPLLLRVTFNSRVAGGHTEDKATGIYQGYGRSNCGVHRSPVVQSA